jgi:hypothetical protein
MIAEAVLDKPQTKPVSTDKIRDAIKNDLTTKIAESQINSIYEAANKVVMNYKGTKTGNKKHNELKETLREQLKANTIFKFSDSILDNILNVFENRMINIEVKKLQFDDYYNEFMGTIIAETQTIFERALHNDTPAWGIYLDEQFPDKSIKRYLVVVIVQVGDMIWIPTIPDKATLENGDELTRIDFSKLFQPIYETLFPTKKDRGMVRVTGPKGGQHLAGEVFTPKTRDQYKPEEKKVELDNGYSIEIFVTK